MDSVTHRWPPLQPAKVILATLVGYPAVIGAAHHAKSTED